MFCLSKDQYDKYQQHIQNSIYAIEKSRDPKIIYKWNPGALVNKSIDFTICHDILAKVVGGPILGPCPKVPDSNGLTIRMSDSQLNKYSLVMEDTVRWTPSDCVTSIDPILSVYRDGKMIRSLNDDLDIIFG